MHAWVPFLAASLVALVWSALDSSATAAFEVFRKHLHHTARDMDIYWEWLAHTLPRAVLLVSCVIAGAVAASWNAWQNPLDLGWLARASLWALMVACSVALVATPSLWARHRLLRFAHYKAEELRELVSQVSTKEDIDLHLEPAELATFGGVDGWTAWHPLKTDWSERPVWAGLTPVVYLRESAETSLIVPVDFTAFLAWKLPRGAVAPGRWMPIFPRCSVKSVSRVPGREGWSLIHAELDVDDAAA
ncbi:hypothetical protein Pla123a_22030 [Posidoniimonas polymericola]|uniref:Uncharacterized protein n=1 Tax=Posidoniimonas polymericola TaxID=2528002 RepID=A0A5C5YRI1_9BACT|nr:hypothetical protein Pla123a_22030 [Posidoniimonas polymericola]